MQKNESNHRKTVTCDVYHQYWGKVWGKDGARHSRHYYQRHQKTERVEKSIKIRTDCDHYEERSKTEGWILQNRLGKKEDKGPIYAGLDTLIVHKGSSCAYPLKDTNKKITTD